MTIYPYLQLDVFAHRPGAGNPLAVVFDADALDGTEMQAIAHWLGLSETVFLLTPTMTGATHRLRIFTPRRELPFAGHPSVGAAHALLESGRARVRDGQLWQECGAGLLPLSVRDTPGGRDIAVRAPRAMSRPGSAEPVLASLGTARTGPLPPVLMDNGPWWWCVELTDETAVRNLAPDLAAMAAANRADGSIGVAVFARCTGQPYALVVRAFVPGDGISEDPVTGSANAAIAALLQAHGTLPDHRFRSSQGREVGRDGIVEITVDTAGDVWIGGLTQTVIDGDLTW